MQLSFAHHFAAPLERVMAMFGSEEFGFARSKATGALDADVLVDGDPGGEFRVVIRRTMPTDTLRPEFRSFVGSTLSVRYSEAWEAPEGDSRDGTFVVEIIGAPARAAGSISLAPAGDGCELTLEGKVTTTVPFLAHLVTEAVSQAVDEALTREVAAADAWLLAQ